MIITLMFVQIVFGILMGLAVNGGDGCCSIWWMGTLAAVVPWHVDVHDCADDLRLNGLKRCCCLRMRMRRLCHC